jgi:hypothetical protein
MSTTTTQLSTKVHEQLRLSASVEHSATALAERVHLAFLERLPPILGPDQPPPDLQAFVLLVGRWLAHGRRTLEELEAVYARELRWDQRLRLRRDEAVKTLIGKLRLVQGQLDNAFGKGRSGTFAGFGTGLQDMDPALLTRIAQQAVAELRAVTLVPREPLEFDVEALAASIEAPLAELQAILLELGPSLRNTQLALEAKQAQLANLTRDIRRAASILDGLYRIAGLDFHADRLRPKKRGTPDLEEEPPPAPIEGQPPAPANAANDDAAQAAPAV